MTDYRPSIGNKSCGRCNQIIDDDGYCSVDCKRHDDRPSIAELQRRMRPSELADALPVLLEIAAAALALDEQFDFSEAARVFHDPPMQRLLAALAKVRS